MSLKFATQRLQELIMVFTLASNAVTSGISSSAFLTYLTKGGSITLSRIKIASPLVASYVLQKNQWMWAITMCARGGSRGGVHSRGKSTVRLILCTAAMVRFNYLDSYPSYLHALTEYVALSLFIDLDLLCGSLAMTHAHKGIDIHK